MTASITIRAHNRTFVHYEMLLSRTRSDDLSLLAKRDGLAALRADVVPRALAQVVFLGKGGMITGLSAPLLLEDYGTLLLHRGKLRAKIDDGSRNL